MLNLKNTAIPVTAIHDDVWKKRNITLSILRLDQIHPVISGNKLFKLHHFLLKAMEQHLQIITFGGAYSNHLAASAAACNNYRLPCIGIVRGERPRVMSPTLLYCSEQNMRLEFLSRSAYSQKQENTFLQDLGTQYGSHVLIPEGGFSMEGARGASEIYGYITGKSYTHICCSVGTATTLAGLLLAARPWQHVLGFSALKNQNFNERIHFLLNALPGNYHLIKNYHFSGYAKKTGELINFMNAFYEAHSIPLDFVYTGKMMYGVIDLVKQNYFPETSRIICIHTGGLQGNSSLTPGVLKY